MYRLAVFLFATQCTCSSAAVVHNLRAESVLQKAEVMFSEHIWNNTMTKFVQHEIVMTKADPPQVDKVMYVLFTMIFGCCGCDRCFMGQVLYGCIKGFTFGGFLVWHIIDYFLCIYVSLAKHDKIEMMGYNHTFKKSTIEHAFVACIVLLILNIIQQFNSYRQHQAQMAQQQEMLKALNASATSQQQQDSLGVPVRHQSLAHIPTPLTAALRKTGIVTKEATIPELIAAFNKMDKDGDGKIDRDELKEALSSMGVGDEDVDAMIKEADTDGDGNIDKDEFLAYHAKKAAEKAAEP